MSKCKVENDNNRMRWIPAFVLGLALLMYLLAAWYQSTEPMVTTVDGGVCEQGRGYVYCEATK